MATEQQQTQLIQWYSGIKERGHCKAIAQPISNAPSPSEHTRKHGMLQIPIVSSSLVDRFAKKVEKAARKPDTLESLFNIF